MKTLSRTGAAFLSILLLLSGCGGQKKMEPVSVGEMETYKDPAFGFQIQHPKGWVVNAEVGRAAFYNAPDVDKKFLDPTSVGAIGVEIAVAVTKMPDPAGAIKKWRDDRIAENYQLQADQSVTVAGKQATKTPYAANYGKNNVIYGHHIFVPADSILYDLSFSGFGDYYNAYNAVFEASLNSFQLPKPVEPGRDVTLPSEAFSELFILELFEVMGERRGWNAKLRADLAHHKAIGMRRQQKAHNPEPRFRAKCRQDIGIAGDLIVMFGIGHGNLLLP